MDSRLVWALVAGFASAGEEGRYTFALLVSGGAEATEEELGEAMKGHFANMQRLAEERRLLVAGPLGEPRAAAGERGIFVFDAETREEALELAGTDPSIATGILRAKVRTFDCEQPLGRLFEVSRAQTTARRAEDPNATWVGRSYVIATCADGTAATEAAAGLASEGLVLLHGRLGADASGEGEGELLAVLDATELGEAREMLASADPALEWVLRPWYSDGALAELPFLARCPDAPIFDVTELDEQGAGAFSRGEGDTDRSTGDADDASGAGLPAGARDAGWARGSGDAEDPARASLAALRSIFERQVEVFGVRLLATEGVPDRDLLRAAHLLAQLLDADEDGVPDDADTRAVLAEQRACVALVPGQAPGGNERAAEALADAGARWVHFLDATAIVHEPTPERPDPALATLEALVATGRAAARPGEDPVRASEGVPDGSYRR